MRAILKALAILGVIGAGTAAATAESAEFKPAVIFDMGGKFDKSFNEAAYRGAEKFKAETGIPYAEFEVTNEGQRDQALRRMAQRSDIVVAVGFAFATPLEKVAAEFPDKKFVIIDYTMENKPNIQSVVFKEHEGSFLVGMAAALKSRTGKVGFVGGMDIPLIRNFAFGYEQGVKHVNPNGQVIQNYTGTTPAAWTDVSRAKELAISQIDQGADVIYAAAGQAGLGALEAAADKKKYSIGVDSNQNYLHPGSVLTSMVKRVDVAVYNAFKDAKEGTWKPGALSLGLKEEGVGYAVDEYNRDILTPDIQAKLEEARQAIIEGRLQVKDYQSTQQ
ncbi:BMP family lipoprotein [Benzoatithermus flavus]|uniref:BMP family ABC transporter substrate-binding protein n=1 Tax=Benzoatithermus flavus TaxID=3108223 RepID=A0ABU8XTN1_9PROT